MENRVARSGEIAINSDYYEVATVVFIEVKDGVKVAVFIANNFGQTMALVDNDLRGSVRAVKVVLRGALEHYSCCIKATTVVIIGAAN